MSPWSIVNLFSYHYVKDPDHHSLPENFTGYLIRFLHKVYLPIFDIITQLYYYRFWFFRNSIVNTHFFELVAKTSPASSQTCIGKTFIHIKVLFSWCNHTWFNTGIFINNTLFLWYIIYNKRSLVRFYCPNILPRTFRGTDTENFRCDPTC